jgi:hypothetical protein
MNSKGQAALEYLMTYGWALVVMVVVIAALVALDVFNLGSVTDTCAGFPTNIAYQKHVYSADGSFKLSFLNGTGQRIDINSLKVGATDGNFTAITSNPGASSTINASGFGIGGTGTGTATAGDAYKVAVTINYNIPDLNFNNVKAQGTCLGKYQ